MGIYAELDAEHMGFLPHTAQPVQSCINAFDCLPQKTGRASAPPSWPIIGNLLDVPKNRPWSAYADLSNKYGRCNILGTPVRNQNPRSKAMLSVFAFFLAWSSYCVRTLAKCDLQ